MFVGIDDTDSPNGMCTTFVCKQIMDEVSEYASIMGIPRLIRLNPNIPYKTRGNGALSFETDGKLEDVMSTVKGVVKRYMVSDPRTNPGAVFLEGKVPPALTAFYHRALHEMITIDEASALVGEIGATCIKYGNGRGIIGALASIGADLPDKTYELIAYRTMENIGTKRRVDAESVMLMDKRYRPGIFDSYDWHNKYLAISPNAPCPVLYGIRGEDRGALIEASSCIESEPIYKTQVFLTNQATDAHIQDTDIDGVEEYMSVHVMGKVADRPRYEHKGHAFFNLEGRNGSVICAAYEPTKEFRNIVADLSPGDDVEVWGGVKRTDYGLTINLEKIRIVGLAELYRNVVPKCCDRKMQSIGAGKGYRCRACGRKVPYDDVERVRMGRRVGLGLYEVPTIARRHLAKPICRM